MGDQSEKTERESQSSSDTPADSDNNSGIMCGDFSPHAGSVASGRSCTNCLVDFSRGRGYASADRQTLDALKVHRDTEANFVKCQPPRDSRRACQLTGRTTADSPGRIRRPRICDGVSQPAPSKTGVARRRPQNYPWQNRFVAKTILIGIVLSQVFSIAYGDAASSLQFVKNAITVFFRFFRAAQTIETDDLNEFSATGCANRLPGSDLGLNRI